MLKQKKLATSKEKLRVAVLMGGKSIEREVSFNSGRTICDHLDAMRYDVIPLFQTQAGDLFILPYRFLHRGKISDFEHRLHDEAQKVSWDELKQLVDFVYIAVHGRYAEDGTLQGMLEVLGIPYLGSKLFASAINMNKRMQMELLARVGIATPKGVYLDASEAQKKDSVEHLLKRLESKNIQFPVIVKPNGEGSSLGVTVVHSAEKLKAALEHAVHINPEYDQDVLVEEKLEGMEFCCVSVADKSGGWVSFPPTEIVLSEGTQFFDYEQKYMPGRNTRYTPARTDEATIAKIQSVCIAATKALEITTVSRIDGTVTKDGRVVLFDPNALSGMGPSTFLFKQAAHVGMGHADLINHLIEAELAGMVGKKFEQQKAGACTTTEKKTKIAVLFGGRSHEREVSLDSGRNVVYKLSPHKYDVMPLFVSSKMELYCIDNRLLVSNTTQEIEEQVTDSMKVIWSDLSKLVDFVFIGLHGGEGENGAVQGTLEMLGVPYNGSSVLASSLCMDKYKTNKFLAGRGFDVPSAKLIAHDEWKNQQKEVIQQVETFGYPLIVKPHDDGCSVMVAKADSKDTLVTQIEAVFADGKSAVLIEECVGGMELTVGVIGNEKPVALPPSQALSAGDILSIEEKFLPGAGENQTPAPLSQKAITLVQNIMQDVFKAIGCKGYARIDCFYQDALQSPTGKERVVVLELNSLPGLTPATCIFHQAAEVGMKPMEFIDRIVELGFEEHRSKNVHSAKISKPSKSGAL